MRKRAPRSSKKKHQHGATVYSTYAGSLAHLHLVAINNQFSRVEEDPALAEDQKLSIFSDAFESLIEVIHRLSRSAPETAPELWLKRTDKTESVFDFIERVYGSFIGKGLKKSDLRQLDPSLYKALFNWTRHHRGSHDFVLPTKKEANDRLLSKLENSGRPANIMDNLPTVLRERLRLYRTASSRERQKE